MLKSNNTYKTADLYDIYEENLQVCEPIFRHFGRNKRFFGPIVTLSCFEDNSFVREQLSQPGRGQVLVVDTEGSLRCAMLGDQLAQKAVDNGWAGILIFGCIRDSAEISEMALGVLALGTTPRKSGKTGIGEPGDVVTFGGVTFRPGHWLYADEDGIVVLAEQVG